MLRAVEFRPVEALQNSHAMGFVDDHVANLEIRLQGKGGRGGAPIRQPFAEHVRGGDRHQPGRGIDEAAGDIGGKARQGRLVLGQHLRQGAGGPGDEVAASPQRAGHELHLALASGEQHAPAAPQMGLDHCAEGARRRGPSGGTRHRLHPVEIQRDLIPGVTPFGEFRQRQIEPVGREGGCLGPVAEQALRLERFENLLLHEAQAVLAFHVACQVGRAGQVEQGDQAACHLRQAVFDAGLTPGGGAGIEDQFRGRADANIADLVDRTLGDGVEGPDFGDLGPRAQHDAQRMFRVGGKQVDDFAHQGDLARLVDTVVEPVSGHGGEVGQDLPIHLIAAAKGEESPVQPVRRGQALQSGFGRRDEDAPPVRRARQSLDDAHAPPHHIGRGRGPVVGKAVPGRQYQRLHAGLEAGEGAPYLLRAVVAGREIDRGRPRGAGAPQNGRGHRGRRDLARPPRIGQRLRGRPQNFDAFYRPHDHVPPSLSPKQRRTDTTKGQEGGSTDGRRHDVGHRIDTVQSWPVTARFR